MTDTGYLRDTLTELRDTSDRARARELITSTTREIPKSPEYRDLFEIAFEAACSLEGEDRSTVLLDVVREIPTTALFHPLYRRAAEEAMAVADSLPEANRRITELMKLAKGMPATREFLELRRRAWRLLAGLPDKPRFRETPLEEVARELPKASDLSFYRRYTLLGIAREIPLDRDFMDIYHDAISRAIDAVALVPEPYYRKYALLHIKDEIPDHPQARDLFERALREAVNASFEIKDPFAKQDALIDMLKALPKTPEFFPLLQDLVGRSLAFFTVRRWMEDIEVTDVVDFILSAEELGLKESKKKRYSRGKYANYLSRELEDFGVKLNDVRFVEVLKPYTHVWVQPKTLRDSVKKVVDHLESLKKLFHGCEVMRPALVAENHASTPGEMARERAATVGDCISIDLGATNTVVMRKRGDAQPDFVVLGGISRSYDNVHTVPTVIGRETNAIGAEVIEDEPVTNIKQMLLEGNPRGREQMERYFRALYQRLRENVASAGWFSRLSKNLSETLYVTVPVGFGDYRDALAEIARRTARGTRCEFIEEPLAAAVGYEVAEARDKLILVIDFGGSTLDVLLLRMNLDEVHVVARPERAQILGGADIDGWLAEHLASMAGLGEGAVGGRLLAKAEEIKIGLSHKEEVPFEWQGRQIGMVTREEFEKVLDANGFYASVDRAISYVLARAEKVGLKKDRIEAVLLTGGSSQIPSFKDKIGYIFPELRDGNYIYDHSPLTAVGRGAALYGTKDVIDRHLGVAYAMRYTLEEGKEQTHSYTIVLEKGETLPLEKTFRLTPSEKLGPQKDVYVELFVVPESLIVRRWVKEDGVEFIKQELQQTVDVAFEALKTATLSFPEPVEGPVEVTFRVNESGVLTLVTPGAAELETGLRLQ